jgi:transcriptional regulator of acetoin/glycerol metabolism
LATTRSVDAAREYFLTEGRIPDQLLKSVRPPVLQSWRRSILSGAEIASPSLVYQGEHHARAALCRAADPVLSRLAEQLVGLQAGVLLADHRAVVVRRWAADPTILTMMNRIHSDVGFSGSEEFIGTNGIGSPIESRTPIQISGPEHLADALTPFTCVGVPIHHPVTQRLEGVITMNYRSMTGNPLLTPLMTSTVHEIESRLLAQASITERHLLDEYLMAVGARRAPVAAIGKDIFIAGPRVTELLEGVDRALLWDYVQAVALGSGHAGRDFELATDGLRIARCEPVVSDGRVVGAVVEFETEPAPARPAPKTVSSAPRPTAALPGKSAALQQAIARATQFAANGVPMIIEGETGVGKFALARAVLESTLASSTRTAVVDAAVGWMEGAHGFVTVLRRELELMPDALVLRHLESLTSEAAAASAAVIEQFAADHGNLPRIIATMTSTAPPAPTGLRRLIDTIGVGRVVLPPLRDRREDIAPAAIALLTKHRGSKALQFSSSALRCLIRAQWPGNLRQLDATVRGLASSATTTVIRPDSLPVELQGNTRRRGLSQIEELELTTILEALRHHEGNKVAAAQTIGISRSTLYRKLQAYHVDPDKQYF